MNPAAFIHALQHLTEDSNGVLWVVGNPTPLPQLRDASTSSNRDTSLRNPRRHQRHKLSFQDLVASEEQRITLHPAAASHTSPRPPPLQSSNIFLLPSIFFFCSFSFTFCISFFVFVLFLFSTLPVEKPPEGRQHNRHQNSFSPPVSALTHYPARRL